MLKIKLGSDSFEKHRQKDILYVDKSLLIKDLIDDETDVLLITRPRRFGKSLNLSMVKTYFEKGESNKSSLFKNLKIWETGENYRSAQGKYPVISMSLKNVAGNDWEQTLIGLKAIISDFFSEHYKVRSCLDKEECQLFDTIKGGNGTQKEYELSLGRLSKWLERYYGEKSIILIDEYDAPINRGYTEGYKKEIISFMRDFLGSGLKSNESFYKAILTGVTRIAGESLFSGLNNFRSYSVLSDRYSEYFGFTEEETKWVMESCESKHEFSEIKKWYDGYTFGNTKDIYNPWSIMNVAIDTREMLKSYWINSGSDTIIKDQLAKARTEVKEIFYAMIKGEKVRLPVADNVTYDDLINGSEGLWSFLLYAGYLTAENSQKESYDKTSAKFFIPNLEVRGAMKNLVAAWLTEKAGTSLGVNTMLVAMLTGDVDIFSDLLLEYIYNSFSYFDTTNNKPELMYHAFILGLLAHLSPDYYFNSNPEAGVGRADILIMPKVGSLSKNAVILEFKKARKPEELEPKTKQALEQIKEKDYIKEAQKRGAEIIHCYGIGFYKQEMMMETAVIK